jgi:glycosyltransferase involved in cell wall biosynthesis
MSSQKRPLVSAVIAFMNEEQFLGETIESVLQQDYDNFELLLIDDGSTNKSTDIAKDYSKKYPGKIFYFDHENHQNHGVCISRNLGVEKARGDLIAI